MSTNNIIERIKKLEDNQDYIKELLNSINTKLHNIKFELENLNKIISKKEDTLEKLTNFIYKKQETPEINELIENFKNLKTNPKPVRTKLNLFYSKDDINIRQK